MQSLPLTVPPTHQYPLVLQTAVPHRCLSYTHTPFAPPAPILLRLCLLSATGAPPSHCAAASCAVRRCLDFHNFLLLCLLLCPSCSVGCSAPTHCLGLHHTSRLHLSSCPSSSVDCHVAWCFAPTLLAQLCLVPWPPPLIAPLSFGCLLHWPSPWPIVLMVVMLPLVSGLCLSFMFMTVLGVVRRLSCHCTRPMQHLLPQGVTQRREQVQVDGVQCSRNTADVGPKS